MSQSLENDKQFMTKMFCNADPIESVFVACGQVLVGQDNLGFALCELGQR